MASSFDAWALLDEYHLVVDCIVVTILVAALHRNYVHRIVTIAGGCCALAHVSPAPAPRRAEIVLDPADERRRDRHETPRRRHKRRDDATNAATTPQNGHHNATNAAKDVVVSA